MLSSEFQETGLLGQLWSIPVEIVHSRYTRNELRNKERHITNIPQTRHLKVVLHR